MMSAPIMLAIPPDPRGAATPIEFARRLRSLMDTRRRSVDSVTRRSRDAGTPISRATVYNLITAGGVPRRETVVGFLRGCGVPPREQIRWLTVFDEVYPDDRRGTRPRKSPESLRQAHDAALRAGNVTSASLKSGGLRSADRNPAGLRLVPPMPQKRPA